MTKDELMNLMAKEAGITKKAAAEALDAFVKAIHDSLKKKTGKIRVADLGTFTSCPQEGSYGVNPQTKKKIKIAGSECYPALEHPSRSKQAVGKAEVMFSA